MEIEHGTSSESFVSNYQQALTNPTLQHALTTATGNAMNGRQSAVEEIGENDWQQLRNHAREIKEHTLNHLDFYLERFTAHVERSGGHIFWAETADDASGYIVELAHRHGINVVVKGKSMMSEEIGLNTALLAAGIEAVETDLGEYIVQLAGERPSHLNMPAIHKTRDAVADLFAEKLHVERPTSIPEMAGIARRLLRQRFAEAGMGITGINYAVAECGTIVLVENEGNIRLTTSLPRVHVAIMGIEKVIPQLADVDVFLKLLSRSASGQKLCSYVSFLKGVKQAMDEEGPEEFHVVLVDNGRVEILANPHLRESLLCIRCGACLNACPVYQKIGGHAYGWVYPGPIGAVLTPQMIGRKRAADLPFASSLCGACRDVCPVKIDIPKMLLHLRHEIKEELPAMSVKIAPDVGGETTQFPVESRKYIHSYSAKLRSRIEVFAESMAFKIWKTAMSSPAGYRVSSRCLRLVQRFLGIKGRDGKGVLPVARWTATRELPMLAPRTFRERFREFSEKPEAQSTAAPGRENVVAGHRAAISSKGNAYRVLRSSSTGKETMLARISEALARTGLTVPEAVHPFECHIVPDDLEELTARFSVELESVGGRVAHARSGKDVEAYIRSLLSFVKRPTVAFSDGVLMRESALRSDLQKSGVCLVPTLKEFAAERRLSLKRPAASSSFDAATDLEMFEEYKRMLLKADIGITSADYALADTGTLVLLSGKEQHRLISLLPPVHVCMLDPRQILWSLTELLARVREKFSTGESRQQVMTCITGPSRTADIEQALTLGVHGPQSLHVLLCSWDEAITVHGAGSDMPEVN